MPKSLLHLLNLDTIGGVEELFVNFLAEASSLSRAQQHVLVTGKKPHPFFKKSMKHAASCRLEKYVCGWKVPSPIRFLLRKKAVKKCHCDTVILWNRIEPLDRLKKCAPNSKIIYYEHGASWMTTQGSDYSSFFNQVDRLIVNSNAARRLLQLKWAVKSPITVIHNPLKPTITPALYPKEAPNLALRPFVIGFIGRLIPLKGVPILLHALKLLHDQKLPVILRIAGTGPEKQQLQELVKKLGISKICSFLGCIENVSEFYESIDLLVAPSIREPLGLVAQEAQMRGCPVIASCIDGLPEVVIDGHTGYTLVPSLPLANYKELGSQMTSLPDLVYNPIDDILTTPKIIDPTSLAEKISLLAKDPPHFEVYSKQAIKHAQKRPTFTQYTAELMHFLTELE